MRSHYGQQLKQNVKHFQASSHYYFGSTVLYSNLLKFSLIFGQAELNCWDTAIMFSFTLDLSHISWFCTWSNSNRLCVLLLSPDPLNCQLFWLFYVLSRIDWIAKTNTLQICRRLQWTSVHQLFPLLFFHCWIFVETTPADQKAPKLPLDPPGFF